MVSLFLGILVPYLFLYKQLLLSDICQLILCVVKPLLSEGLIYRIFEVGIGFCNLLGSFLEYFFLVYNLANNLIKAPPCTHACGMQFQHFGSNLGIGALNQLENIQILIETRGFGILQLPL